MSSEAIRAPSEAIRCHQRQSHLEELDFTWQSDVIRGNLTCRSSSVPPAAAAAVRTTIAPSGFTRGRGATKAPCRASDSSSSSPYLMREAISINQRPSAPITANQASALSSSPSTDEGGNQWRSVPTRGYFDVVASDLRPVQRDRRHRASDSRSRTNVRTRRSRHDSHQRPSEAIRGHTYQTLSVTMVIRGHQWS